MSIVLSETDNGTKREVVEALKKYDKKLSKTVADRLEQVWDQILWDAIMECPIVTGTLVSTIKIVEGAFGDMMGTHIAARTVFDRSIVAGDETIINPRTGQPCIYAQWVHDGHSQSGTGRWIAGHPFLEIALDMNMAELETAIEAAMKEMEQTFGED